jgi:hypothetical protein
MVCYDICKTERFWLNSALRGITFLINHKVASLQTKWNTDDADFYDFHRSFL